MEELPNNSDKAKNEQLMEKKKAILPVVTPKKKKSAGEQLLSTFFAQDFKTVGASLLRTIFVPAMQKLALDMITGGAKGLIYGDKAPRDDRRSPASRVSYSDYYGRDEPRRTYISRGGYDYNILRLDSVADVHLVQDKAADIVDQYHNISIAELYEIAGQSEDATSADFNYGWTDARDIMHAREIRTRDGYWSLDLPSPRPLK